MTLKTTFTRTIFTRILLSAVITFGTMPAWADTDNLPQRVGPRPETTAGVPHVQVGVQEEPELTKELLRRVEKIHGIDIRPTIISLPGAKGFWLDESIQLVHPEVIVGGREFAHVHPDGSLHAALPPKLASKAVEAGWAIHHPWANQREGWGGFVMIYTPKSEAEVDVVFHLIVQSYNFITGLEVAISNE